MADLLSQFGQAASSFATTVTHDASQFVQGAQQNVAQLTGSAVRAGKVVGPLAEAFGSDPVQFTLGAVKHFDSFMRDVATRVAHRTGTTTYSTVDVVGRPLKIHAVPAKSDNSAMVALIIGQASIHHPAIVLEEASRSQQGIPAKRGLGGGDSGYTWHPVMLRGSAAVVSSEQPRGFFGIDEAAAGAAALAIIVAIAPGIIMALISVASAAAPTIISAITGAPTPEQKKADDAQKAADANKILGVDPMILGIVAAAAVGLIILVSVMRKKGGAA